MFGWFEGMVVTFLTDWRKGKFKILSSIPQSGTSLLCHSGLFPPPGPQIPIYIGGIIVHWDILTFATFCISSELRSGPGTLFHL